MAKPERRLLVVDDEVEICNFVRMFFEQRGFTVAAAYNGDEAVKLASEKKPQVILLDVNMKREDEGFEALPRLREAAPDAKILLVTGKEDEASVLRGRALGAEDYITKPLVLEYLETTVLKKIQKMESENGKGR
jgi:DNA-binding response OmpR family regulator